MNLTIEVTQTSEAAISVFRPFLQHYHMGFSDIQYFSGNTYFGDYDEIIFSIPESNHTGLLNATFPFNYRNNPEYTGEYNGTYSPYAFPYIIDYNCTINQDKLNYNYIGSVNTTLECGEYGAYYRFYPSSLYYQTINVNASNSLGTISDTFVLISYFDTSIWDSDLSARRNIADYNPNTIDELSSNWFISTIDSFAGLFPNNESKSMKSVIVWFMIIALSVLIWGSIYKYTNSLPFTLSLIAICVTILLFALARLNYVSYTYPYMMAISLGLFALIKIKGNSYG